MDEYIFMHYSKDTEEEWSIMDFWERNLIENDYMDLFYRVWVKDDNIGSLTSRALLWTRDNNIYITLILLLSFGSPRMIVLSSQVSPRILMSTMLLRFQHLNASRDVNTWKHALVLMWKIFLTTSSREYFIDFSKLFIFLAIFSYSSVIIGFLVRNLYGSINIDAGSRI